MKLRYLPRLQSTEPARVLHDMEPVVRAIVRSAAPASERWPAAADPDDLAQEARLGLLLGLQEYEPGRGRLETWLARRAYQAVIDCLRKARRHQAEPLDGGDDEDDVASRLSAGPEQDPFERVLQRPREQLARAIARAAHEAGPWAEEALDRLVEAHEAGLEAEAKALRRQLAGIVSAAMAAVIAARSARAHVRRTA